MNSSFRPLTIKCTSIFGQANKGGAFLYEIKYRVFCPYISPTILLTSSL